MTLSVVRLTVDYVHISNKKYTNIALNFRQGEEADLPAGWSIIFDVSDWQIEK
jgi:hypothetical protein